MKSRATVRPLPFVLLLCLATAGCLNLKPVADPMRYFLLSSPQTAPATSGAREAFAVGMGPVNLPDYLLKPWLVVRTSDTEIRYADFNKWGEYLNQGVQRAMAEQLALLLNTDQIRLNTWREGAVDAGLYVTLLRFEAGKGGEVVLDAQWQIENAGGTDLAGRTVIRKAGPDPDMDPAGSVEAMSEALSELCRVLAAELQPE